MTIQEIATRLVEYCRQGDFETAQRELYSDNAISIEPHESPSFAQETKGLDAIIEKGEKFKALTKDLHAIAVSEPLVTANSIAFILTMDITMLNYPRQTISELCVYEVSNGKIVSERFFA